MTCMSLCNPVCCSLQPPATSVLFPLTQSSAHTPYQTTATSILREKQKRNSRQVEHRDCVIIQSVLQLYKNIQIYIK